MIKYDLKDKEYKCTDSEIIHLRASSSIGLSKDGSQIVVGSNDGYVIGVKTSSFHVYWSEKHHKMPVTASKFLTSGKQIMTSSADYTYWFISNTTQFGRIDKLYFVCLAIVLLTYLIVKIS